MKTSSSAMYNLPALLANYPFKVETPELGTFSSIWNGEVQMACKVLRHAMQQTVRYSRSQDPIFIRVYSETIRLFNKAISYKHLTTLNFISIISFFKFCCFRHLFSFAILSYYSLTSALICRNIHAFRLKRSLRSSVPTINRALPNSPLNHVPKNHHLHHLPLPTLSKAPIFHNKLISFSFAFSRYK